MRLKHFVVIAMMAIVSVIIYQFYHHKTVKHSPRDDTVVVKPIERVSKSHTKRNSVKEAIDTLERSDSKVSQKAFDRVKQELSIPIQYLVSVTSQSDIRVTYDNKLSITNKSVAESLKTMLLAGYQFDLESLKVYDSDSDNVYQFVMLLKTKENNELSVVGNYVLGTGQFEFVSIHGMPVNVMF